MKSWDAVVIGGGFYGLYLAELLATHLRRVLLCESGSTLMNRASYANQARVHNGYHYPRSILTAVRSRVNFPRFVSEFRPAIVTDFQQVYAVARQGSKVTADQFVQSMERIGAQIETADQSIRKFFDLSLIEAIFRVREYAFDAIRLRNLMIERVRNANVEIRLNSLVKRICPDREGLLRVHLAQHYIVAKTVVSCAYSQTNTVCAASDLPVIPLKHELAELALINMPAQLQQMGITVMDGPYFSCMPFPSLNLQTLSHVRYTPHGHWYDGLPGEAHVDAYELYNQSERRTAFGHMVRDAERFVPLLSNCQYRGSLWEVKTVLPRSETDDSRPILLRLHHGLPNYHIVLGGKIDNVYDIGDELTTSLGMALRSTRREAA